MRALLQYIFLRRFQRAWSCGVRQQLCLPAVAPIAAYIATVSAWQGSMPTTSAAIATGVAAAST